MRKRRFLIFFASFIALGIVPARTGFAGDDQAELILKKLDETKLPIRDPYRRGDPEYRAETLAGQRKWVVTRYRLIKDLYDVAPDHPRIAKLMSERWSAYPALANNRPDTVRANAVETLREIEQVLAKTENQALKLEGAYIKAYICLDLSTRVPGSPGTLDLSGVDEFLKLAPKDERASLLLSRAIQYTAAGPSKEALEQRLIRDYPESDLGKLLMRTQFQRKAIGKPFELEFTDAITGSKVSIKDLKGKLVVIDFWSTTCPACISQWIYFKQLYKQYHSQGLEFIGVSLDEPESAGGLDALKKMVRKMELPWPQYYQGQGIESAFSTSWQVQTLPTTFVVGPDGNLLSVDPGLNLLGLISEHLKIPIPGRPSTKAPARVP